MEWGVEMGDVEVLGHVLAGVARVPVVAVDEVVVEVVLGHEAQEVGAPFRQLLVEVFLLDEVLAATGCAQDPDPLVDHVHLRLVLEAPGPDVDLEAEFGELLGQFQDVDHLTPGVGGAQGRLRGDVPVGRNHADSRQSRLFGRGDDLVDRWAGFGHVTSGGAPRAAGRWVTRGGGYSGSGRVFYRCVCHTPVNPAPATSCSCKWFTASEGRLVGPHVRLCCGDGDPSRA